MSLDKPLGKPRLNLELPPAVRKRLDELIIKSDASSINEVVRKALAAYDFLLDHKARGGKFILRDSEGKEETLIII